YVSTFRSPTQDRLRSIMVARSIVWLLPRPRLAEEAHPVAVHDALDVGVLVAAAAEQLGHLLQVGDGVQVAGRLLLAVAAVEVGADGGGAGVAGELADAVDVVAHVVELDKLRVGFAAHPALVEHPVVESHADDGAAGDEPLGLLVAELPLI